MGVAVWGADAKERRKGRRISRLSRCALAGAGAAWLSVAAGPASAQGWNYPGGEQVPEDVRINAQLTEFIQGYPSFRAPYSG
ncbi:hypothetical protein, partial [Stenotrophomonas maltophilia]|uniref:hypothetical protein n=1 Tax=Stenotrophomonas maltophilia TaxID=40324 RepID=UPI00195355B7